MPDLYVDGIDHWIPIALYHNDGELIQDLWTRYPDHDPAAWEHLIDLRSRIVDSAHRGGLNLLALWARLPSRTAIVPDVIANLVLLPTGPDPTPESVTERLFDEVELLHNPVYHPIATASGPATAVEAIETTRGDGESLLGHYAVVWIRPAQQCALVLSATTFDLVAGAEWCSELYDLACGVHGF